MSAKSSPISMRFIPDQLPGDYASVNAKPSQEPSRYTSASKTIGTY